MNKMISLAKIMFASLAVYLSIGVVRNFLVTIMYAFQESFFKSIAILISSSLLSCAYLVAIIYFLVLKSDKWTHKLIAKDIQPDSSPTPELTLTMAFRLVSVGAGLYCLMTFFWSISQSLSQLLHYLSMNIKHTLKAAEVRQFYTGGAGVDYIKPILLLAFAVYLLCGAPHFVRWQVKKTLKLCNEPEKFKNNPSQ